MSTDNIIITVAPPIINKIEIKPIPQEPIQIIANYTGKDGLQGNKGDAGLSAYEIAVQNGFVGTQAQWLTSMQIEDAAQIETNIDFNLIYQIAKL